MASTAYSWLSMGAFAVERRSLPRYLRWRLRSRTSGGRPLHRMLARQVLGLRPLPAGTPGLDASLAAADELGVRPGWLRLAGDSQRRQVFERDGQRVVQLFTSRAEDADKERRVRDRVGPLAPRILERCASGMGWSEEWIDGPPPRRRALREAWAALSEHLYRPREVPRDHAVSDLRARGLAPDHQPLLDAVVRGLPPRLPWSRIHGDLWLGNMGTRAQGGQRLVLFDWEYSRRGPTSYDVWSFVFQPRMLSPGDPRGLVTDFDHALREVGQSSLAAHAGPLACLHMLDKLTWVRSFQGRERALEIRNLGRWLQSLTDHVCREERAHAI